MTERPLVTVGALVCASDGDILLVRSKKWKDLYSLPGGKVELGESREEAVVREVYEETALRITHCQFAMVQECCFSEEFWQKSHFVMNDFVAQLVPDQKKNEVVLNDEAYEYLWIPPKKALGLPLHTQCRNLIQWYLNRQKFCGIVGVDQLVIQCIIGMLPEERVKTQTLYIDVKVKMDFSTCKKTENIIDTVDYRALSTRIEQMAQEGKYHLLETMICNIVDQIIVEFNVSTVWMRIRKPSAIPSSLGAIVELERSNKE